MKKQLSDEQLDTLLRKLLNDAAANDSTVNEIADSPATWWGVQRQINEEKATKATTLLAWPPVGKVLRWLAVGAPVAAAAALLVSLFVFRPIETADHYPVVFIPSASRSVENPAEPLKPAEKEYIGVRQPVLDPTKHAKPFAQTARFHRAERRVAVRSTEIASKANKKKEIKTEFIALSYARDPESGQIVRVKVPSSMMVSLGLVTSVKAPSDLISAEVLVGDDGLTRAIRFIR